MIKSKEALTVSELTQQITSLLEDQFSHIIVEGEVSNCKLHPSGHIYLTLKDNSCAIALVMFRNRATTLTFVPKDGQTVRVTGAISVYGARGNYQIIAQSMSLCGQGDILQMLEERKRKFAQEGLFDKERKKPLPLFPSTVGVVTASSGAALRDILQITKRRNDKINVVILPCLVQGEKADEDIAYMIKVANAYNMCDVLIVGRGGGSIEDLLPFSSECVVRAIAASTIPIVSAVGHEIDWAISDFVADVRAPTPSSAAELVVPIRDDMQNLILQLTQGLKEQILKRLEYIKLLAHTFDISSMEMYFRRILQQYLLRFDEAKDSMQETLLQKIKDIKQKLSEVTQTLTAYNPHSILDRGYAVATNALTHNILRDISDINIGDSVNIMISNGQFTSLVTKKQQEI